MSKKINLGTISEMALNMLSSYNVGFRKAPATRKQHNDIIDALQKKVDAVLAKRQALIDAGTPANEAISKFSCLEENKALNSAKEDKSAAIKSINKKMADGRALITKEMYSAYVLYMTNGDAESMTKSMLTFLATLGINAPEVATSKFAEIMVARISGQRKATGKSLENGNYTKDKSERAFQDDFLRAFLQILVKEKGVLDENEDYTLSRHDFSKDEKSTPAESAKADKAA